MPYIGNVTTDFNVSTANINNGAVTGEKLSQPFNYDSGTLYLDDTNNRVGMGTISPSYTLDVAGSTLSARIGKLNILDDSPFVTGANLAANSNFAIGTQNANATILFTNNSERLRITSAGLVGIGTSSPSTILHVNASVNNSSDYYLDVGATALIRNDNASGVTSLRLASSGNSTSALVWGGSGSETLIFANRQNERLRIDSSGRVGIGTNSPISLLHVEGGQTYLNRSGAGVQQVLQLNNSDTTAGTQVVKLAFASSGATKASINAAVYGNDYLTFNTGSDTERARIDSSGRLLVGTSTDATARLVVKGSAGSGDDGINVISGSTTVGSKAAIFFTPSTAGSFSTGSAIKAERLSPDGTDLQFYTCTALGNTPIERMRITSSGQIYFGSTTTNGDGACIEDTSNGGRLYIGRNNDDAVAEFYRSGTRVGQINITTTSTSYVTSSDYRLKENVIAVTDGIARLQQLKPSRFNFIADPDRTVDGFLAHEVQAVVPEAITGTKDEVDADGNPIYQGIDQSKLVPLLTAALQEAIAEINVLKDRVAALEGA